MVPDGRPAKPFLLAFWQKQTALCPIKRREVYIRVKFRKWLTMPGLERDAHSGLLCESVHVTFYLIPTSILLAFTLFGKHILLRHLFKSSELMQAALHYRYIKPLWVPACERCEGPWTSNLMSWRWKPAAHHQNYWATAADIRYYSWLKPDLWYVAQKTINNSVSFWIYSLA